jgi:serine/threonine protein kinase
MDEMRGDLGAWTRLEKLGSGGNATVWKARRGKRGKPVALKVVNTRKSGREPYRRFAREIRFLQSIGKFPGVLPLLDASLPEKPSAADQAWLAMPIAVPITEALEGKPLETVVLALAQIADTLARLQAEHSVAHRDLKPSNLYELDGEWLVGDFGLIALPDAGELTCAGRPVGARHYTAYEMIRDPTSANAFPADVYSLGKTLWVLATGQAFPPEGHQPAGTRQFSISDLRPHPHAALLDQLIDRATSIHPEERPSMREVADDLQAWTTLASEPVAVDVGDLRTELLERMADEFAAEDLLEQRKELALAAVRRMNELWLPLNDALRNVHPRAQIDIQPDQLTQNILSTRRAFGSAEIAFKFQRLSQITSGPEHWVFGLRLGRSLELTSEGELIFRSYVNVGPLRAMGSSFNWQSDTHTAPVGSVQADVMLREGIEETAAKLAEGLASFVENLAEQGG